MRNPALTVLARRTVTSFLIQSPPVKFATLFITPINPPNAQQVRVPALPLNSYPFSGYLKESCYEQSIWKIHVTDKLYGWYCCEKTSALGLGFALRRWSAKDVGIYENFKGEVDVGSLL
jgi:hypothetical protein